MKKPRPRNFTSIRHLAQPPVLEHLKKGTYNRWLVWINYAPGFAAGTYLELRSNGSIWRHTQDPTGAITSSVQLKPPT